MKNSFSHLFLFCALLLPLSSFGQGSLTPPGPPAPTMKTLDQLDAKLEKRIDVLSLPGDATASHVIAQPGSYYLSGNLNGATGKAGIRIEAGDVTVNLNGFSLQGGFGTGDGIAIVGSAKNVRISNGSVRGWETGVRSASQGNHAFDHLRLSGNRAHGIFADDNGNLITNCEAADNGLTGLGTEAGGVVSNSTARDNGGDGISVGNGSTVQGCSAYSNTSNNILARSGCVIARNTAMDGSFIGIHVVGNGTLLLENASRDHKNQPGIQVDGGDNRIESNVVNGNQLGIRVNQLGNLIVKNSSSSNPVPDITATANNYTIGPGNYIGKITTPSPGSSGTNPGLGADAANPWVNFSF